MQDRNGTETRKEKKRQNASQDLPKDAPAFPSLLSLSFLCGGEGRRGEERRRRRGGICQIEALLFFISREKKIIGAAAACFYFK